MPFENYENQQRLSISPYAWEIIQHDMIMFKNRKFSSFINQIFTNFYRLANCSIAYQITTLENKLNSGLEPLLRRETKCATVQETIKLIIQLKEAESRLAISQTLERKKRDYISKVFRLNDANLSYLCGITTNTQNSFIICDEDKFYGVRKRKDYIECVIEEYCFLPYIEREKVYFSESFDTISSAIKNERQLDIRIDKKDIVYRIKPYAIRSNTQQTANYLVGYSSDMSKAVSYRISSIKTPIARSRSAHLYKTEKEYLETEIAEKGVEYLAYDIADIIVKFTEEGIRLYNRISTSRPLCETALEPGVEVTFRCTLRQAEIYFWKLQDSVEIVSPHQLRHKFETMYNAGNKVYD